MVIDCHTHWGICWQEKSPNDPAEWLLALDRHGVDKAFLMPHKGIVNLASCADDNDTVALVASKASDRIIPLGTSWPQMGEEGLVEIRRCIEELGMKGLKFHPWLQGFSLADPVFGKMCELAGEYGVSVAFHDGTPTYSLSEQVAGLARRHPSTRFVLGHSGMLWGWRSALAAAKLPNVWLCLCGPHMKAMETICRRVDVNKLMWGSDYGFGFADSIRYRLELFNELDIEPDNKRVILEANPLRLLADSKEYRNISL